MAYGRRTNIRSHRRRGTRRRRVVAPWVVLTLVGCVVLSGLSAGYLYVVRERCTGEVRATVAAAPGVATVLEAAARRWADTQPVAGGRCAEVDITAKDPAVVAQQLGTQWDTKAGPPPDVWVPDSSAWVRRAASIRTAAALLPDRQPSLASSPTVVAMPKPMAEALGWPDTTISWHDLVSHPGWAGAGRPEWGEFRLGMTDPLRSTAGLHALMAILDANDDGEVGADEQATVARLHAAHKLYEESGDRLLANLRRADGESGDAALRYVSAFPALERDVLTYNAANPRVPLVAVYPRTGSADADHPYLVLDAPWSDPVRQDAARQFLAYLGGAEGRRLFLAEGFRDADRSGGTALSEANGATPRLATVARAAPLPESVKRSVERWTALTRRANVLLVLDVSNSMGEAAAETGRTRLDLLRDAAKATVAGLPDDARVGLWVYATRLDGSRDHREVVPAGRLADPADGGSRRAALSAALDALRPGGNTGLYDTAVAAQQSVVEGFQEGAANVVLLVTDGRNDDDTGGLTLEQARTALGGAGDAKRVPVVTVGFGPDADRTALRDLSRATGAVSYASDTGADLESVLLTAVLGRI